MLELARLRTFLDQFPRLTIGLIGDLVLDQYLELAPDVRELSLETGLEAYQITSVRNAAGALGTVLNNLAALGVGRLVPVTVIGDDGRGFDLRRALAGLPVDLANVLADPQRLTPTYTKPVRRLVDGLVEELNRLDIRDRQPLSADATQRVCDRIASVWNQCDGLIVLDQFVEPNWGIVNDAVRTRIAELAAADPGKLVYVDSRAQLARFNFGVLKGNRREVVAAAHGPAASETATLESAALESAASEMMAARRALRKLSERTGRVALCTCGEEGMLVAESDGADCLVPGFRVPGPVDVVGAGDAASSGFVLSMLAGATPVEAAAVGNLVASITVQQLGTTGTASPSQVVQRYHEWTAALGRS
jgi:bifunctional ADP-heptose synthase (sugar kinase/adenylyltransferase)